MMIPIVTHFRWLYSLFFGVLFFMLAVAPTFSHAQDCCPVGGSRLWIMDFQYVAERCDSSDNGQSQISVICTDHFLPLPTAAYIVAKDAQGSQRGYVWFEGLVAIGDYYQVNALTHTNLPENKRIIGPSLTLEVWSDIPPPLGSGILMQTITFHTSCSQPITAGDQYGAHVLSYLNFKSGDICGSLTDFGDAPDQSVGNSYPTVLANDGPNHLIRLGGPYLGNAPDSEPDGQPDFNADGDTPDEDGLVSSITQEELQPALDTIRVSNLTLLPAKVTAWLDLNANGDFEESERRTAIVASGSTDVEVAFDFGIFPDLENVQFTYLRIRVSTELDAIDDPIGLAHDGEIEDHQISVQAALLPVGLTEFRAQYTVQQVVTLDWTTATETDNDHFEIERSSDGLYFGMIGSITGAGTSQSVNRYQYIDTKPHRGMNYYRLRQVDFSGSFSYSHVEIVQFRAQGQIAVYPNPASDYVRVEFPAGHPEVLPYTILNMLGVVVWTGSLSRSDAIDVSHLAEGLYQLRVKGMDTKHANTFLLHR